jgi:hypothetical protein
MSVTAATIPYAHYVDPVSRLLAAGDANIFSPVDWPDYPAQYGFSGEHIPDLIRMACDRNLHESTSDGPEVWGPVHAWRALAQLRAVEALGPLVELMKAPPDDDAVPREFAKVFGVMGPGAIPALAAVLDDRTVDWLAASLAGGGLEDIAKRHPEYREQCVGILVRALSNAAETDPSVVGDIIGSLLNLRAVEAIDAIREAFRIDAVDISICGDLEDVEIDLGVRHQRVTPRPHYMLSSLRARSEEPPSRPGFADAVLEWAEPRRAPKVGRNDPCPCGSGMKFKKCCLDRDSFLVAGNSGVRPH